MTLSISGYSSSRPLPHPRTITATAVQLRVWENKITATVVHLLIWERSRQQVTYSCGDLEAGRGGARRGGVRVGWAAGLGYRQYRPYPRQRPTHQNMPCRISPMTRKNRGMAGQKKWVELSAQIVIRTAPTTTTNDR
jgi:hypothetical protein